MAKRADSGQGLYRCPVCTSADFVANGPQGTVSVLGMISVPTIPNGFYAITCTNCGRSDFFHEYQISQYLNSTKGILGGG